MPWYQSRVLEGLLGGEDLDEALAEGVEPVGVGDVAVEGGGVELGEDVDLPQAGVEAVGDGDVDQAVLAAEGHRGLRRALVSGYSRWPLPPPRMIETILSTDRLHRRVYGRRGGRSRPAWRARRLPPAAAVLPMPLPWRAAAMGEGDDRRHHSRPAGGPGLRRQGHSLGDDSRPGGAVRRLSRRRRRRASARRSKRAGSGGSTATSLPPGRRCAGAGASSSSAPTASGKTLAYNLPVLQALLEDPDAKALYLFPTKALSQDQQSELNEVVLGGEIPVKVFTYDGDTPSSIRISARDEGRIIITNPDMLHTGILPNHPKWIKVLKNLRYVVIDEMHSYRGVFGSHMTSVIRRLKRIAAFYGASPDVHLLLGHHRQPARAGPADPRAGGGPRRRQRRPLGRAALRPVQPAAGRQGAGHPHAAWCWRASASPRAC